MGVWNKLAITFVLLTFSSGSVACQEPTLPSQRVDGETIVDPLPPPVYLHPLFLALVGLWLVTAAGTGVVLVRRRRQLREHEAYFHSLIENASEMIMVITPDGSIRYQSPSSETVLGYTREERIGRPVLELVHPDDRDDVGRGIARGFREPGVAQNQVARFRHKDGTWRVIEARGQAHVNESGELLAVIHANDVTARIEAEGKREHLEAQLQQAQKMEAVGQLTGGIAHDFNNLLTVILGHLDIILHGSLEADQVRKSAARARDAADRATSLTQRLLAFSRKQTLRPRAVDLNDLVNRMADLLRRTLGETIQIEILVTDGLEPVEIDPFQTEAALLNLSINGRDAMPNGGRLTVATARCEEEDLPEALADRRGSFALLSVSDTGTGMPPDVAEHVFEPFFTTKNVGEGSGLGLSMVYGFMKQSGGYADIQSVEQEGTTVRLFLPVASADTPVDEPISPARADRGVHAECVLVVEDDESVRKLTVRILERLGYETLEAGDAAEALQVLEGHRPDLLLTDVVLPGGRSGPDLVRAAHVENPDLSVLYMSGYPESAIVQHGRLDPTVQLLGKPFSQSGLDAAVRSALAGWPVSP